MAKKEIFVSCDVETNGLIPGKNAMLQLGAAAVDPETWTLTDDTFCENLLPDVGTEPDERTMTWWEQFPEMYKEVTRDPRLAHYVMHDFADWLRALPGRPIFVGYPACFDFMWVYWYLRNYTDDSPIGFSGLDTKTLAYVLLNRPFSECAKRNFKPEWMDPSLPHTHNALDDAKEQAMQFCAMMRELREGDPYESAT
jgi:DNA polymerase III alpha subunit (gram-positive type)